MIALKNDNGEYIQNIDTKNKKLSFTTNPQLARPYDGEWFAKTELKFIKFHFKSLGDKVTTLKTWLTDDDVEL